MVEKVIQEGDREKVARTWRHILTKEKLSMSTEKLVVKTGEMSTYYSMEGTLENVD